jgi:hypothetical protein
MSIFKDGELPYLHPHDQLTIIDGQWMWRGVPLPEDLVNKMFDRIYEVMQRKGLIEHAASPKSSPASDE